MFGRHAKSLRPMNFRDPGIAAALGALTSLFPLYVLDEGRDPLAGTALSVGRGTAVYPAIASYLVVFALLYVLRRIKRSQQRIWSLLAGVFVGLIPFLFYWLLGPMLTGPAPLTALALRGMLSGSALGLLAAWYVPRSTIATFADSRELS